MSTEKNTDNGALNSDPTTGLSDLNHLARKLSGLYDTSQEEVNSDATPIYRELSSLKSLSDRYEMIGEIARGGMKSVKKVYDKATAKHIALAELRDDVDRSYHEVFLREARLTALLEHPNIISVHAIGVKPDDSPYFTMDLKTGDSLLDIMRKLADQDAGYIAKYPLTERLQIFSKICDAVSYAHARNIIHLDLKPANIQVGEFGEVLVCDWGLGKILDSDTAQATFEDHEDLEEILLNRDLLNHMTFNGHIKGTPGYMSPEQIKKEGEKSKVSDIYALGAILYSICTLERPVEGDVDSILDKTLSGDIKPAKSNPDIPQSLLAIIQRATHLDPEQRYPDCKALQEDLRKYMMGYATEAEQAGLVKEFKLFIKRHRTAAGIIGAALVVITVLCAIFINNLQLKNLQLQQQAKDLEKQASALETKAEELLNAQSNSNEHKKRSEYVAMQHQMERQKLQQLSQDLEEQYWRETMLLSDYFVYDNPARSINSAIAIIEKLLRLNPDQPSARIQLAYCHFIKQDLHQVIAVYDPEDRLIVDLYEFALEYAPLQEDKLLPVDRFNELIYALATHYEQRYSLIMKMMAYDMEKRPEAPKRSQVVKSLLKSLNPEWDGKKGFNYNPKNRILRISAPAIKIFSDAKFRRHIHTPLNYVKIDSLYLGGSGIYDLSHISTATFDFLDITNTNIHDLSSITDMPELRWLVVSKGQFPQAQLKAIPKRISVKVKS